MEPNYTHLYTLSIPICTLLALDYTPMSEEIKCTKCGKKFAKKVWLRRHEGRKTPCNIILDVEELSEEKKKSPYKCRFCGRAMTTPANLARHMRQSCKIVPRNGDTSGMDKLYEYTLKKQEEKHKKELEELEARMMQKMEAMAAQVQGIGAPQEYKVVPEAAKEVKNSAIIGSKNLVDQSTKNITINIFGSEKTDHISHQAVLKLLQGIGPLGEDLRSAGERAILSMAMMIYSDEKHPDNITCYMTNKKGKDALVHVEEGWRVMPLSLTLTPMATRAVDQLFAKQPWPGVNGIEADAKLETSTKILGYIKDHEGDLVGGAAAASSELRAIPIRNKEILEGILAKLPKAGDR